MTADEIKAVVEPGTLDEELQEIYEGWYTSEDAMPGLLRAIYNYGRSEQKLLSSAQLNAAYAALDAVTDWAQHEDGNSETGSGTRLLALLLKHGVHPRVVGDKP